MTNHHERSVVSASRDYLKFWARVLSLERMKLGTFKFDV